MADATAVNFMTAMVLMCLRRKKIADTQSVTITSFIHFQPCKRAYMIVIGLTHQGAKVQLLKPNQTALFFRTAVVLRILLPEKGIRSLKSPCLRRIT